MSEDPNLAAVMDKKNFAALPPKASNSDSSSSSSNNSNKAPLSNKQGQGEVLPSFTVVSVSQLVIFVTHKSQGVNVALEFRNSKRNDALEKEKCCNL